jgi:hypothetical protein
MKINVEFTDPVHLTPWGITAVQYVTASSNGTTFRCGWQEPTDWSSLSRQVVVGSNPLPVSIATTALFIGDPRTQQLGRTELATWPGLDTILLLAPKMSFASPRQASTAAAGCWKAHHERPHPSALHVSHQLHFHGDSPDAGSRRT